MYTALPRNESTLPSYWLPQSYIKSHPKTSMVIRWISSMIGKLHLLSSKPLISSNSMSFKVFIFSIFFIFLTRMIEWSGASTYGEEFFSSVSSFIGISPQQVKSFYYTILYGSYTPFYVIVLFLFFAGLGSTDYSYQRSGYSIPQIIYRAILGYFVVLMIPVSMTLSTMALKGEVNISKIQSSFVEGKYFIDTSWHDIVRKAGDGNHHVQAVWGSQGKLTEYKNIPRSTTYLPL